MDRICFLIEATGERLSCMLNPETLEINRTTGVSTLRSLGGHCGGVEANDDPVFYGGGGRTEMRLDLLFDISLAGSSVVSTNVRDLTAPLWRLTENNAERGLAGNLPLVRIIWGQSWNLLGIITAVAERFDYFSAEGNPQRSWLSLKFRRVSDPELPPEPAPLEGEDAALLAEMCAAGEADSTTPTLEIAGAGTAASEESEPLRTDRLDDLAAQIYGNASWWRFLAMVNGIASPLELTAGSTLLTPPAPTTSP